MASVAWVRCVQSLSHDVRNDGNTTENDNRNETHTREEGRSLFLGPCHRTEPGWLVVLASAWCSGLTHGEMECSPVVEALDCVLMRIHFKHYGEKRGSLAAPMERAPPALLPERVVCPLGSVQVSPGAWQCGRKSSQACRAPYRGVQVCACVA
jgi:hypothetical protein